MSSKCHEGKYIFIFVLFTSILKIDWHVSRSKYTANCHQNKIDNIGGVMIIVIASSVVDYWFKPWSGQGQAKKGSNWYLLVLHEALSSKSSN